VIFEGCTGGCSFDSGAILIKNLSSSTMTIAHVTASIGASCTFDIWPSNMSLPAGQALILAQTVSGDSTGCPGDGTFDTSDVINYPECTHDGTVPVVHVTIGTTTAPYSDTGQVLNTGGIDPGGCGNGSNESEQWVPIGQASGPPAAPTNLTVTPTAPSAVRLTWTDNSSNESGFEINNGVTSRLVKANRISYTWGSLKPNTYMCFHIRAYNSAGDSSWDPNVSPYYVCTTTPNVVSVPNLNWGGYTTGFVNPDPQNYPLAVSATWKVPAVSNCLSVVLGSYGDVTTWVGLGGVGSNDLEQIGTEVACHDGPLLGPYYYAVYDLFPTDSSLTQLSTTQYPVDAGDSMRADVVEQGAGTGGSQFVLQEWDTGSSAHPKNWYFEKTWIGPGTSDPNVTPLTADWIVEDPPQPPQLGTGQETFLQFSPAEVFKGCYWTQDNVTHYLGQGSSISKDTITTTGTSTGTPKELTGPITTNGTQFQVTWKNN
jgi:hypothetical protein